MSERDDFGAFFAGFLIGGVAGAVVSLLYAPQTGEETRTLIKDKAIELYDKASDTVEDSIEQAQEAANEAVKRAELLLKQAQQSAMEVEQRARVMLEQQTPKPVEVKPKRTTKSESKG